MKFVKWLIVTLVVVIGIAVVTLIFWGGNVIKEGVNRVGPQVLGVDVRLEEARFFPLRGHVSLSGMFVGNPEGFHADSLFEMGQLEIDLDVRSLFTDTIVINRILIDAPQITYEVGARRTNLGTLLEQLEAASDPDAPKEKREEAPEEVEPGKNVVIKELILADARAQVSATAMRGRVVPVQLSTITLNDLGGEDQSLTQITTEVMKAIVGAVGNAVAGAGDLLGDGLKSALEGAGAITDFATEGVRGVTDAVGERARGVRDRLGRDRDEDDEDKDSVPPPVEIPDTKLLDDASEKAEEKIRSGADRLSGALGGLRSRDKDKEKEE